MYVVKLKVATFILAITFTIRKDSKCLDIMNW